MYLSNGRIKVLKICINEWTHASRDYRELSAYRELGAEIRVVAKKLTENGTDSLCHGFNVDRLTTRPLGEYCPKLINRVAALFLWACHARMTNADVLSCHDLIALFIGWLSNVGRFHKRKLIYDAHEFELGRYIKRNNIKKNLIKVLERFLIKRCAFSIMVNQSIANEVSSIYKLKKEPIVVRSTPDYWEIDEQICRENKKEIMSEFDCSAHELKTLLMYHGYVTAGRGIELLIEAAARTESAGVMILGNGEEEYRLFLRRMVLEKGMGGRVLFHDAVEYNELWKYVGAADISVIPIETIAENHRLSLPNKLFESIQSMTPVIASDVPEIQRIVEKYKIGICFKAGDANDLQYCINKLIGDTSLYSECKSMLSKAKRELCWENEKVILQKAFREEIIEKPND